MADFIAGWTGAKQLRPGSMIAARSYPPFEQTWPRSSDGEGIIEGGSAWYKDHRYFGSMVWMRRTANARSRPGRRMRGILRARRRLRYGGNPDRSAQRGGYGILGGGGITRYVVAVTIDFGERTLAREAEFDETAANHSLRAAKPWSMGCDVAFVSFSIREAEDRRHGYCTTSRVME